ncbi:MAG: hypothetical protein A3H97_24930 [Acidobacteria bacterium RIFCSPLOWO2_02_FULL_65_29]|nr:MAG: hypothetical protein A3H97_24930 [Acidobacteria bacterium RIFCSPLOWO2_02_FULL_65_29]
MAQQTLPIDLVRSIRRAFVDAPDLRLRLGQARCLGDASGPVCRAALRVLVDTGFLSRAGDGTYVRCASQRSSSPDGRTLADDSRWDCCWAVPMLADAPLWLDGWLTQWTCLRDGGPRILGAHDCERCPRWEPRLVTHRPASP